MSVVLLTGNHPRHKYLVNLLQNNIGLSGLVIENREMHVPVAPSSLDYDLKKIFDDHFRKRDIAENLIFKCNESDIFNKILIEKENLNSETVLNYLNKISPSLIITTGIGVLNKKTISSINCPIWNIHGGISPEFKGAITHFWPSYLLKPQFTGCTIHYVEEKIDAGEIIHQTPAVIEKGDNLHTLSCKSLKLAYDSIVPLIIFFLAGNKINSSKQKGSGKLWLNKDWQPHHLNLIYKVFNDSVVDHYLNGSFGNELPKLYINDIFKNDSFYKKYFN